MKGGKGGEQREGGTGVTGNKEKAKGVSRYRSKVLSKLSKQTNHKSTPITKLLKE